MMPTLTSHIPVPQPSYTQARENLVKAIPPKLLCLLACGGKDCRYEGPECWKANQQVIRGLFSSWWDYVPTVSQTLMCYKLYQSGGLTYTQHITNFFLSQGHRWHHCHGTTIQLSNWEVPHHRTISKVITLYFSCNVLLSCVYLQYEDIYVDSCTWVVARFRSLLNTGSCRVN